MSLDKINNKALIGSIMPKAYIKRIDLETGGANHAQQKESGTGVSAAAIDWRMRNNNPHIDIVSTHAKAAAGSGVLGYRELENVDSSHQYKSNENKLLVTKLTLEIKEIIDESSLIGTWFANQEFHKYINFMVLRSNSALITNALVNGVLALPGASHYTFINPWTNEEALSTIINEGHLVPVDVFSLSDVLGTEVKQGNENYKNILKVLEGAKTTTSDGLSVYSFTRMIQDVVSKGSTNPKHLSYFVASYINLDQLAQDKEASVEDFNAFQVTKEIGYLSPNGIGNVSSEIVIDNFKLHNKTYIFRDPKTGEIWPGPIHMGYHDQEKGSVYFDTAAAAAAGTFGSLTDTFSSTTAEKLPLGIRGGLEGNNAAIYEQMRKRIVYYAGESPDTVQPPLQLKRETISNNKVQDFRSIQRINKLNIDLSLLESVVSSAKFKGEKKSNIRRSFDYPVPEIRDLGHPDGYFTKLSLTKDLSGQARFLFGFDFKRYILNNSTYAGLINASAPSTINTILAYSTIKNIKITRNRVKDSAAEASIRGEAAPYMHDNGYEKFDKEKLPLILIDMQNSATNQAGGQTKPYQGRFGRLSEVSLFKSTDFRVRHFSGVDMTMKGNSSGKYQYAVELEIEDGGEVMMARIRRRLKNAVNALQQYHNRASQATDEMMKRYTDDAGGTSAESFLSNRLPETFINEERKKWPKAGNGPWCRAVDKFITVLKSITPGGDKNPAGPLAFLGTYEELAKQIYNFTSPETANVNSIGSVVEIMSIVLQRMDSLIGMQAPHPKSRDDFSTSTGGNSDGMARRATNKLRTMKIKYYFSDVYDASSGNINGYDYLTARLRAGGGSRSQIAFNTNGLTIVPRNFYVGRIQQETRKYFQSDSQPIDLGPPGASTNALTAPNITSHTEHAAYTYLSPSTIRLETETQPFRISGADSEKSMEDYNKIMTKIILYNLGQGYTTNVDSFGNPRELVGFQPGMPNSVSAYKNKKDLALKTLMASALLDKNVLVTAYNNPIIEAPEMNPVELNAGAGVANTAQTVSEFVVQKTIISQPATLAVGSPLDDTALNIRNDAYNVAPAIHEKIVAKPPFHEMEGIDVAYLMSVLLGTTELVPLGSMSLEEFDLANEVTRKKIMAMVQKAPGETFGKLIPNQIKSLMQVMRSSFSPGTVKTPIFSPESQVGQSVIFNGSQQTMSPILKDPYRQMDRYSAYYMNYINLVKVQVLVGYNTNDEGEAIINKPIWKNLNVDVFNEKKNNRLLYCRLVKYDNPIVKNHEHPEVLNMPIIDQHFFIENEGAISVTPAASATDTFTAMSSAVMNILVDKERVNMLIGTEYVSSAAVNSAAFNTSVKKLTTATSMSAKSAGGTTTTTGTGMAGGGMGGGGTGGY